MRIVQEEMNGPSAEHASATHVPANADSYARDARRANQLGRFQRLGSLPSCGRLKS